uniref:NPHS1-1 n=1 Tax=Schmidtea mediterranea TaxID=79327 RepID=A0A0H3YFQ1_SCHMD|nr:NPHS1-1 [Schmidtea mediterranea]
MLNFWMICVFVLSNTFINRIEFVLCQDPFNVDDLDAAESISLSQSSTCTEKDDIHRIQCFRELPSPKYDVLEGKDVLMGCRVAHQQGKLQWAFKGKMLGFDRNIPTYPRMRMTGNAVIGDHSLFIENVKVSDSGNYECQLSPAASQPPRRRMTKLTVLKVPSTPIIYQNGQSNKQNISVSIKKDEFDSNINLTCVSLNGNPVPTFEWSVNRSPLKHGFKFRGNKVSIETINDTANSLSMKSSQIMNGDIVTCGVENNATRKMFNLTERIIKTQMRVFKRILPGKIVIKEVSDIEKTVYVTEGHQLQLSCVCNNPGDPPIDLKWNINEDDLMIAQDKILSVKSEHFSQNTFRMSNISRKWHRKELYCSGSQDNYAIPSSATVLILVNYPPSKIEMEAISIKTNVSLHNPSTVYCKEGQKVKLSCTSDNFFTDNVRILWFIKSSEESDWKPITTSFEKTVFTSDGRLKYITSSLEVPPSFVDKDISSHILSRLLSQVVCIVKSTEFNIEIRRQLKIELFEEPSVPVLTLNNLSKPQILTNGESAKLKCTVTGGHPTPQLRLLDERDREMKSSNLHEIGITRLEYNIEVKPRDNEKKFRCIVSYNNVMDFESASSELMALQVANPPKQLHMKIISSMDNLIANQNFEMQCHTDSSFPEAKIEWWWHHSCKSSHTLGIRSTSKDVRSLCQSEILNEPQNINYQKSTQSTFTSINVKLTPEFDLSFIECMIIPHEKWITINKVLSKLIKIRVRYPPQFLNVHKLPNDVQTFVVEKGNNFSIAIKSIAHPSINGYTWLVNKQPMEKKIHIDTSVDKFSIVNAQPEMMANYSLLVENNLGKAAFDFFLNITYGPTLLGASQETIKVNPQMEHNHKAMIMCSAQANPSREQLTVEWIREISKILDQEELLDILKGQQKFISSDPIRCTNTHQWNKGKVNVNCISFGDVEIVTTMQIMPIDYRFIGSYRCIIKNSDKRPPAIKTIKLVYPTRPNPVKNFRKSEFAAQIFGKSELFCYFIGFPVPTVKWMTFYKNESLDNPVKYFTSVAQTEPGYFKAVLAISDTNESDLGKYICVAGNQYGESSHVVILNKPRSPTQPINFTVINVTETSVSVGWILRFNGGSKQQIKLYWRLRDTVVNGDYQNANIFEDEEKDVQFFTIYNLYRNREYEISIISVNEYSPSAGIPKPIIIKTMNYVDPDPDSIHIQNDSKRGFNKQLEKRIEPVESNNFLIIILLATVGVLLLTIKIGLIVYFVRKRKLKHRKSREKLSSPPTHQRMDTVGFISNDDSIEMRPPSLVRSGIESNLYAQSISDHMSQNGSDTGLKLNYYKTHSDDQFSSPFLGPELDLVASVRGRNNYDINALSPNFHPGYIQFAESSSMTSAQDPYIKGYYTQRPYYNSQTPSHGVIRKSSHSSNDTVTLPQYPISSSYQKRMDKVCFPQSAVSISTNSGDSNCSQSPPRKYIGYSPMVNQSGAPSTVEEYLSSGNSASESHRFGINGSDEYFTSPMSSFRLNQGLDSMSNKDFYSQLCSTNQQNQESAQEFAIQRIMYGNDVSAITPYRAYNDHQRLSTSSDNEHLLKPPLDFSGIESNNSNNIQSPMADAHKLSYVDLIAHSSPSVIRFTGPISENL